MEVREGQSVFLRLVARNVRFRPEADISRAEKTPHSGGAFVPRASPTLKLAAFTPGGNSSNDLADSGGPCY